MVQSGKMEDDSKRGMPSRSERAAGQVNSALRRFFSSNASRGQLPSRVVERLDDVRMSGVSLLAKLRPYNVASVFYLEFQREKRKQAAGMGKGAVADLSEDSMGDARLALDKAAAELLSVCMGTFPSSDADMETTAYVMDMFFLGGIARYGPEVIFESNLEPGEKAALAERFAEYFESRFAPLMAEGATWSDAKAFHLKLESAYGDFKAGFPDLFSDFQKKLHVTPQTDFVGPFGMDTAPESWRGLHFDGKI
jgi:hypothetical protein